MAPSRRRSNSSLLESSTIIAANLIMASSSYLLSKMTTPQRGAPVVQQSTASAPAAPPAWPPAVATRSVQPTATRRMVLVAPDDGEDCKVDERAGKFIRSFRERTQSDMARMEAEAAAAVGAAWPRQPPSAVAAGNWAGTVHGYYR